MHPESNPLGLPPGRLYIKTPDGNEVPLSYNMAEITPADEPRPVETESGWINPAPPLPEISIELAPDPAYDAWLEGMRRSYIEWLQKRVKQIVAAILEWALINRPDWVQIYRRTKKKRTRKKYYKRIIQAYREELQSNERKNGKEDPKKAGAQCPGRRGAAPQ